MSIITLTTDFGNQDPFVGIMKGVILGICPDARIVDVVHEIDPGDIRRAARILLDIRGYFPAGTVHVAVVDPGVGTKRRALALESGGQVFVGPDNGIFSNVLEAVGAASARVFALENPRYFLPRVSGTFHGRDVFAPVAAWIARGIALEELGALVSGPVRFERVRAEVIRGKRVTGAIIGFDRFGNAETNISRLDIAEAFPEIGTEQLRAFLPGHGDFEFFSAYGNGSSEVGGAIVNSAGRIELFLKDGNMELRMQLKDGDEVLIEPAKQPQGGG